MELKFVYDVTVNKINVQSTLLLRHYNYYKTKRLEKLQLFFSILGLKENNFVDHCCNLFLHKRNI